MSQLVAEVPELPSSLLLFTNFHLLLLLLLFFLFFSGQKNRGSMDRVYGVVHGPGPQGWSMDPGPCFVYVPTVSSFNMLVKRSKIILIRPLQFCFLSLALR